jgi:hypothetical protein
MNATAEIKGVVVGVEYDDVTIEHETEQGSLIQSTLGNRYVRKDRPGGEPWYPRIGDACVMRYLPGPWKSYLWYVFPS